MNLKAKYNLWKARRAAKKYNLDFNRNCVFDYQMSHYGLIEHGQLRDRKVVEVPMQSGKIGLYKATVTLTWPGNTGQKNWKFEFQGYKHDTPKERMWRRLST